MARQSDCTWVDNSDWRRRGPCLVCGLPGQSTVLPGIGTGASIVLLCPACAQAAK